MAGLVPATHADRLRGLLEIGRLSTDARALHDKAKSSSRGAKRRRDPRFGDAPFLIGRRSRHGGFPRFARNDGSASDSTAL